MCGRVYVAIYNNDVYLQVRIVLCQRCSNPCMSLNGAEADEKLQQKLFMLC